MNAKKAKKLRRIARAMIANAPTVSYQPLKSRIVHRGPVPIPGRDMATFTGDVRMIANCTRAVYQRLKKQAKSSAQTVQH